MDFRYILLSYKKDNCFNKCTNNSLGYFYSWLKPNYSDKDNFFLFFPPKYIFFTDAFFPEHAKWSARNKYTSEC